jgi:hypothetical protein
VLLLLAHYRLFETIKPQSRTWQPETDKWKQFMLRRKICSFAGITAKRNGLLECYAR